MVCTRTMAAILWYAHPLCSECGSPSGIRFPLRTRYPVRRQQTDSTPSLAQNKNIQGMVMHRSTEMIMHTP